MAAARPVLIWSLLIAIGIAVAWLFAARRIAFLLDRLFTVGHVNLPVSPLAFDVTILKFGELSMPLIGTDNLPSDLRVETDSTNSLVLIAGGNLFVLGPRTTPADPSRRADIQFTPEAGDELTFTSSRSLVSQPTPFAINFLGGSSPWWKRFTYYRLRWKKQSGARLEMLWRFEQQYYAKKGWNEGTMMFDSTTGLLFTKIVPEIIENEAAVMDYVSRTKGWKRDDYRIENRGLTTDGRSQLVAVIYLEDIYRPNPGAGKSLVVYVDRSSRQVTKELGFQ